MSKEKNISAIMVLSNCGTPGMSLAKGKTYKVPSQVSQADAEALIRIRRAIIESSPTVAKRK